MFSKVLVRTITFSFLISIFSFSIFNAAHAIPAFSAKTKLKCIACHSAWPQLNSTGRKFKELGYRFPGAKAQIKRDVAWNAKVPISFVLKARPYDKKDSGDSKVRALHEVEIIVGGAIGKKFSGFFEIEAEDEDTNARGFDVGIPHASFTYHHSRAANIGFAWGGISVFDPYESFVGSRRLTRGRNSIIDKSFGGADNDGKLSTSRQSVGLYGRINKNLFYSAAISGVADDSEGVNANTLYARLVYDFTPNWSAGLLSVSGTCETSAANCATDRDYSRVGIDTQFSFRNYRFNAAWLNAKDDNVGNTNEDENSAWYIQGYYIFKQNNRPSWVPLVRFDQYESTNGTQEFSELTLNVAYYFRSNIKGYIEYWDQTDVPAGVTADSRFTLQLEVSF